MGHDDGRARVLPKGLVQPSHLFRVDDGVVAIRCKEDIVDDDDIPATNLMCVVSTFVFTMLVISILRTI